MNTIKPIAPLLQQVTSLIQTAKKANVPYKGLVTGYTELDYVLGGFQKSTLNVVASRPSMGKSAFIDTMIVNMAINSNISLLFYRGLARESDITLHI